MSNIGKVITESHSKIMIRYRELPKILTPEQMKQWEEIIAKVRRYQEVETAPVRKFPTQYRK